MQQRQFLVMMLLVVITVAIIDAKCLVRFSLVGRRFLECATAQEAYYELTQIIGAHAQSSTYSCDILAREIAVGRISLDVRCKKKLQVAALQGHSTRQGD